MESRLQLHVFSRKQISPDFFSEPQPQPPIPWWRFWAKQERKPRVSRASLTMQDHDFIVKKWSKKIDGSLPLCRNQHRRNLRILYDGRVFQMRRAGGVNRILRRSSPVCQGTIIRSSPVWKILEKMSPAIPILNSRDLSIFRPRPLQRSGYAINGGNRVCSTALTCSIPLITT